MAAPAASFTVIPTADTDPDSPVTSSLFTNLVANIENVFAQLVGDPVGTPTFTPAAEHDHDGVNSKVVNGADFILVEKKLITSNVTTITFSGLNGDVDEVYKLIGRFISSATTNYILRPNALTTNLFTTGFRGDGTTLTNFSDASNIIIAQRLAGGQVETQFEALFHAKKDPNSVATERPIQSTYNNITATIGQIGAGWLESTVNLTSIELRSTVASQIRDGSTIALYKLRQ